MSSRLLQTTILRHRRARRRGPGRGGRGRRGSGRIGADSGPENEFHQTNLISDLSDQGAQVVDPNLQNPWGLAFGPTTPLWVADNDTGVATLYSITPGGTTATQVPLTVTLPGGRASTSDGSSPTGQVFNPTSGFVVTSKAGSGPGAVHLLGGGGPDQRLEPGRPTRSSNGTSTAQVEFSSPTAVYKGLTIASTRLRHVPVRVELPRRHGGRVQLQVPARAPARELQGPAPAAGATPRSASRTSTASSTSPTR